MSVVLPPLSDDVLLSNPTSRTNSRNDVSPRSILKRKKKTIEDYEFVADKATNTSVLGKGTYGVVRRAKDKESGRTYAIKIMNKKTIYQYSTKENLKREINIQKSASHPHIVRLHRCFEDNDNVYLVLEYAQNGTLFHYLRKRKRFSEGEAFIYFFQTCLGLDYLHKKNIIHRDLKPENLLLDSEGNIKICDFGWSIEKENYNRNVFCGTIDYMSPEMLKKESCDHNLDIWSLGILLYELIHGGAPVRGKTDEEKMNHIKTDMPIEYSKQISAEVKDLIASILQHEPRERLNMMEIFTHPWMRQFAKTFNLDIMSYVFQQDEQIKHSLTISKTSTVESDTKGSPTEQEDRNKQRAKIDFAAATVTTPSHAANASNTLDEDMERNFLHRKSIDIESYLRAYKIHETEENGLLKKIEMFASTGDDDDHDLSPHFGMNSKTDDYSPLNSRMGGASISSLDADSRHALSIRQQISSQINLEELMSNRECSAGNYSSNDHLFTLENENLDKHVTFKLNKNGTYYVIGNNPDLANLDEQNETRPQIRPRTKKRPGTLVNMKKKKKSPKKQTEKEPGLWDKFLMSIGCYSRNDNKESLDESMDKKEEKEKPKKRKADQKTLLNEQNPITFGEVLEDGSKYKQPVIEERMHTFEDQFEEDY